MAMIHSKMMGNGQDDKKGIVFYDQHYRMLACAMASLPCSRSQNVCSDVEMQALWTFTVRGK